jgi:predicted DNA-binding WGR domain protein
MPPIRATRSRMNSRVLVYLGRNDNNLSRASYKIYMVGSRGRTVRVKWGAVEVQNRSIVPTYLQMKSRVFPTKVAAHLHVLNLIERKLASGYEKAAPSQRPPVKLFD